jgi:hypothetical protein
MKIRDYLIGNVAVGAIKEDFFDILYSVHSIQKGK